MNTKRMIISLVLGALFGVICASGSANVELEGFEITMVFLAYVCYNRILLGFVIGLADHVHLLDHNLTNSAVRGAILGVIVSLAMAIMSGLQGGLIYLVAGLIYGIIIDIVATKLAPSEQ